MDTGILALIGIGIVALIVAMNAFKFWSRRRLRETAQQRRVTEVPKMLAEFGQSIILEADPTAVTTLIEALPKSKAKQLSPGVWGINYAARDDILIEVRPTDGGSEVLVVSVREYLGFPQGLDMWRAFADKLVQAAHAAGVATRRGSHGFQRREGATALDSAVWVLS
jgi:hypothetical protein